MKIVINKSYGVFGLSHEAILMYKELANLKMKIEETSDKTYPYNYFIYNDGETTRFEPDDIKRNDVHLVKTVETLKEKSFGTYAKLKIIDIPDDCINWTVHFEDGNEFVYERAWF